MWVQVAMFVASLVISQALQPKAQKPKAATMADFDMPTTDDGTPKTVVFGDVWLTDWCVIGAGNFRAEEITKKQKGLFGSKKVTAGHRYGMTIHMGLSLSLDDIVEIKVSDKTLWAGSLASSPNPLEFEQWQLFGGDDSEGGIRGILRLYTGAVNQAVPNELIDMYGTAPAYRGCFTAIFDGLICANSPYPKPWSFRVRRTTSGWDQGAWYAEKATIWLNDGKIKAMNPAHIIYEAFTDRAWGRGLYREQLDDASFRQAADVLYAEDFGMCLAFKRQSSIQEFIQEVLDHVGGAVYLDRLTGLWRFVLIRQNYDANTLPLYSYGNGVLRIEEDNNASGELAKNQVVATYIDPISNESRPARAENLAAIQQYGVVLENKTYNGIPTAELAGRLAARDMKIAQSGLKRFKVILDRRAFAMQPLSVFKLSMPHRGIESIVLRSVKVEHNNITNGEITVTTIQDVFGLPSTNFIKDQPSLHQPPNLTALAARDQRLFEVPFMHLLDDFSPEQLNYLNASYVMPLATAPNQLHLGFQMLANTGNGYVEAGENGFVWCNPIHAEIEKTNAPIVVVLERPLLDDVEVGQCCLLNDEILRITAIDRLNNSLTLARGCGDTVPHEHAAKDMLWIYQGANVAEIELADAQTASFKLLPFTSSNVFAAAEASILPITATLRHQRPYPPADVLVNGLPYPAQVDGNLILTWKHRNRIAQGSNVITYDDAYSALENDVEYVLEVLDANDNLVSSTNISAVNTINVDYSAVSTAVTKIRLYSVRDGLASYQAFEHSVVASFNPPYNLQGVWNEDTQSIELTWDFD